MFTCGRCKHTHDTVHEARVCYGLTEALTPSALPLAERAGSMTTRQEDYLRSMGATNRHLRNAHGSRLSMQQASDLITKIKAGYRIVKTITSDQEDFARGMFSVIPNGYFCIPVASMDGKLYFVRVSEPKVGRSKGTRRMQVQSGNHLYPALTMYENGTWSLFHQLAVEIVLVLAVDYKHASIRYARERRKCGRCNSELTDPRSRHYGIGPECEKHWPWFTEEVDAMEEALA